MKKTILTTGIAMLFVIGSATFIGCGNSENHDADHHEHAEGDDHHEHAEDSHEHAKYQCPMKCEGDKTFDEAGDCSVCGMELKEI